VSPPDSSSPIWHPFTQHALTPDAIFVSRGEGAWLETKNSRMLDAISSWWVITHGHRHPKIVKAIQQQADALDQVIFAGFTHQPAEDLARALVEIVPRDLTRVFYSDSGSTAVEVALKMALGFWKNCGKDRTRIIALEHAYHGDTIGTMSAGARGVFNAAYAPLLFDVVRLPFPAVGRERETLERLEAAAANAAVLIVEPLILGAGGMMIYSADILRAMASVCRETGTLLIADEAMTGFGRTGTLFACEQAGISPDILCLAKGLSGGSLPLAATLCREEIFAAHYSTDRSRTFFHSSSFTANPIACAAARANLEIWRDEPVLERIARLAQAQEDRLASFRDHRCFENVRRIGTITALDLKVADAGYLAHVAPDLIQFFHAKGILLRPLGNTIYVLPPYCVTAAELDLVYDAILEAAGKFG
jgi:adenosylmethionine-8-amino-7-oxononanoate aminotransferase